MGTSAITALRDIILNVVRQTAQGEWKLFIVDEDSRRIVDSVIREDDILQENVTNIEQIEHKRTPNPGLDAVYLLSPEPHIVDCLVADIERRRYRRCHLIWTSPIPPPLRQRIDRCPGAQEQIVQLRILNVDFFPRESHLITFRDPYSFLTLFHPACNHLVQRHMEDLAQKIVSVCVSLGEYPIIRYYRPRNPLHEASVLCSHLARFVQESLDQYAQYHKDFPPPSSRPRGTLIITDRSMDLFAPLIHEFTYQAMVHELLPLQDGDKTFYKNIINAGTADEEEKTMELGEKDRIWVENRHLHMKDLLAKLVADFNKFRADNPQFAESSDNPSTLNNIKDMIAGLPQFQEGKEAYTLHLNMSQECMNIFQRCQLPEIAIVEQSMATGLDEDFKKPKNVTDQVVRLLDDEGVTMPDRLRLILQYVLHRDGVFSSDIQKLLAHAQLPPNDQALVQNLDLLGARVIRQVKDTKSPPQPLFPRKQVVPQSTEDLSLSRFEPAVKMLLEDLLRGTLEPALFPYTKPQLDGNEALAAQAGLAQSSLRAAKPTWAKGRSANEPRQRIFVFMAGGATYSEARACYEASRAFSKDVFLATSHMLTPSLFLRQVGDLGVDRRQLGLPADRPPRKTPAHVFEADAPPPQRGPHPHQHPPTAAMANMNIRPNESQVHANGSGAPQGSRTQPLPHRPMPGGSAPPPLPPQPPSSTSSHSGKMKEHKEKKRGFFKF